MEHKQKKEILFLIVVCLFVRGRACGDDTKLPPAPDFRKPVDYIGWFREQLRSADEDNAYSDYEKFFQKATDPAPDFLAPTCALAAQYVRGVVDNPRPWAVNDFQELQAYLESISSYLLAYKRGTRHKFFAIPSEFLGETLFDTPLLHIGNSRVLSEGTVALAWRVDKGFNVQTFLEKMETVFRHSDHILQGFTLLESVVAVRERTMAYTSILAALNQDLISSQAVEPIRQYLNQSDSSDMRHHLTRGIQLEKIFWWDFLQQLGELSPILGRPRLNEAKTREMIEAFAPLGGHPSRSFIRKVLAEDPRELARLIGSYHSKSIEIVKGRFVPDFETAFHRLEKQHEQGHPYFRAFSMTSFSRSYRDCLQTERKRRITHLALQLLLHYRANASFPESLSQLEASGVRHEVIKDPLTDRVFSYDLFEHRVRIIGFEKDAFEAITVELDPKHVLPTRLPAPQQEETPVSVK